MVDAQRGVEMTLRRHMNSQGTRGSGLRRKLGKVEHFALRSKQRRRFPDDVSRFLFCLAVRHSCQQDHLCLGMHAA